MKDMTNDFFGLFKPVSALVFFQRKGIEAETYVEHYDMDRNGTPINAHPLTVSEARKLSKALHIEDVGRTLLKPKGIMKTNILFVDPNSHRAMWFTKAQKRELYFCNGLGIPSGTANVPAMLWLASRDSLNVFALKNDRRPTDRTRLYYAPFFNIYKSGNVCMGSVSVKIKDGATLEEFTSDWENYFFNSYFSHLLENHNPIEGNGILIWKKLVNTDKPFPTEVLKVSNSTIKDLMS